MSDAFLQSPHCSTICKRIIVEVKRSQRGLFLLGILEAGMISARNIGRTDRNIFYLLRVIISHSPHVPLCVHFVLKRKFYRFLKQFAFMVSSTLIIRLPGTREQRLLNDHRPQCGSRVQARGILRCCLRFQSKFLSKYEI